MSLDHKDLELIESIIYKSNDDVAISLARSFERLEQSANEMESRNYQRLREIEDKIESNQQDISDTINSIKEDIRDLMHFKINSDFDRNLDPE